MSSARGVPVRDTILWVEDTGEVDLPVILCLHSLFVDGRMFEGLVREAKGRFRVVRPDFRSQGSSAPATGEKRRTTLSPEQQRLRRLFTSTMRAGSTPAPAAQLPQLRSGPVLPFDAKAELTGRLVPCPSCAPVRGERRRTALSPERLMCLVMLIWMPGPPTLQSLR